MCRPSGHLSEPMPSEYHSSETMPRKLFQRCQVLAAAFQHFLVEARHGILLEVGRLPVRLFRFLVLVLLVDEHAAWLALHPMGNEILASRLQARCRCESVKYLGDLSPIFLGKPHPDSKADHGSTSSNQGETAVHPVYV